MRIGHGYDVHKLVEGRKLILGGVEIPTAEGIGLLGHSDADVLLHAITDAVLGAFALGDIGQWFPDDSPEFAGASSRDLLVRVLSDERLTGVRLVNLDCTVIAQRPKLAPHIPLMRERLAAAMSTTADRVSIKATTEEGLGFSGAGLGIAAHAVALIEKE